MSRIAIKTVGEQMDQAQRIEDTSKLLERIHALEQALGEAQKFRETACAENSRLCIEVCDLKAKLRAFEEAMERCSKPEWSGFLESVADHMDFLKWKTEKDRINVRDREFLSHAAINLRYMATSFTLKANFVPSELRIAKYEKALNKIRKGADFGECLDGHEAWTIARDALKEDK